MLLILDGVGIHDGPPVAAGDVLVGAVGDSLDQPFGQPPMRDQVGNRTELEVVPLGEATRSGSRAIVPSSFMISQITAEATVRPCARYRQTPRCDPGAPGCRLRAPSTERCVGGGDVVAAALGIDRHRDRAGAIMRRDACRDASRASIEMVNAV